MGKYFYIVSFFCLALLVGCQSGKTVSNKNSAQAEIKPPNETKSLILTAAFFDAKKEMILGNKVEGAALFQKCLEIYEWHAPSLYELARLNKENKEYEKGLEKMKKAVRVDPDNEWYQMLLAELYEGTGRYDESSEIFQALTEANPKKLDYRYNWANALLLQGKYKESVEMYNTIEKQIGVSEEISIQKYRLYLKMNDTESAIAEINRLIESSPTEARYYGMLAELYKSLDQNDKVLETYEKLLKIDPDNPYIHLSLSDYYEEFGEKEKSFTSLKKAFLSKELNIDTKIQILLNYYNITERDPQYKAEAFELNEILIEAHPKDPKARAMYADFLFRDNKLEEARDQYRIAVKQDNGKFLIWRQLLFIESELNDFTALLAESEEALELFPSQPLFYFFNGAAHLRKKNYEEAIEVMEAGVVLVVENQPLESQFYASLGDACNHLKRYEDSEGYYDKALELDPQNFYVLNNYSYFLSLRSSKLEKAEEMARICVDFQPNSPSYLDTYAWVLYKRGKFKEAKEWLQRAVQRGGQDNDVILEHLGDVLYRLEDRDGAMEYWKKAKAAGKGTDLLDQKISTGEWLE